MKMLKDHAYSFDYMSGSHIGDRRYVVVLQEHDGVNDNNIVSCWDLVCGDYRNFKPKFMRAIFELECIKLDASIWTILPQSLDKSTLIDQYKQEGKLVYACQNNDTVLIVTEPSTFNTKVFPIKFTNSTYHLSFLINDDKKSVDCSVYDLIYGTYSVHKNISIFQVLSLLNDHGFATH